MSENFEQLGADEARNLVNRTMAFTGMFADWILDEISQDDPSIFVVTLPPITLHRKIGPFPRRTRLTFKINANREYQLRFGHRAPVQTNQPYRLDAIGQEAVVLVLGKTVESQTAVGFSLNSSVQGEIINAGTLGKDLPGKQIFIWLFKVIDPADMVGWYDPMQLARTGVEVFVSTLFGRHADYRLMEALSTDDEGDVRKLLRTTLENLNVPNLAEDLKLGRDLRDVEGLRIGLTANIGPFYDFSRRWQKDEPSGRDEFDPQGEPRDEIWIDYVGDVGDGWNSTYAIAHCLAQPTLQVDAPKDSGGAPWSTKRGEILIFGGDQVYPIADRMNYLQRLLGPYETALDETSSPHPHAFAIPGNHDWYDSLVSFTRLFCQRRWFAGWQTNQTRSYFALKLPGRWWILGTDVQLSSDIDVPQVNFFKRVATRIEPGDRVIICTAEPHWVYAALYGKDDSNYNENNLAYIEKKVIPAHARIVAFIAGDQHHYRRYEQKEDFTQKITAGGGGAFLHPTHGEVARELEGGFQLKRNYPDERDSWKLGLRNLLFLRYNFWFGVVIALLYLLTAWSVMTNVGRYGIIQLWPAIKMAVRAALVNPFAIFWILAVFIGFWLFTDTHSKWYRWVGGSLHGAAHLSATFLIGWFATRVGVAWIGLPFRSVYQLLVAFGIIVILGWVIGSTIMGLYLLISLNGFGRHSNEAFSALAIEDWKNFLRLRIDKDGQLTIFPICLPTVPTKWKRRTGQRWNAEKTHRRPELEPDNQNLRPCFIEEPILFQPLIDPQREKCRVMVSTASEAGLTPAAGAS